MTKSTVEVLRDAKALLETKGGTQGSFAKDAAGIGVPAVGSHAVCFCAWGALWAVGATPETRSSYIQAFHVLSAAMGGHIPAFNDAEGRTLPEVLAKFEEAIAAEEAKALEVPA